MRIVVLDTWPCEPSLGGERFQGLTATASTGDQLGERAVIVVLVLGCAWSPLSIPALFITWWLAWRHPFAAGRLTKALTAVTVAVIIGGAIESPVRTVLAQFAWMSRLGCVIMLGLGFILIDRQLTPDDPGSSR